MVNGRVNRIIDSARSAADRELQQRLLGVGVVGVHAEPEMDLEAADASAPKRVPRRRAPRARHPVRIYISNPTLPTRWSQPAPMARIEAAARTLSTGVTRIEDATRQKRLAGAGVPGASGPPVVLVAGTLDTKGEELRFIRDVIAGQGLRTRLVDVSTSGKLSTCDVSAQEIALNHGRGGSSVFGADRGASVTAMADAFANWLRRQGNVAGIISAGGSGGASLVAPAMRALPVGVPKLIVSSVASGDVGPYVGPADITMMYSVTDVQGLNSISRAVLANGANAIAGMVKARLDDQAKAGRNAPADLPAVGITMFGVTTPGRAEDRDRLRNDFECLVFHATGVGGRSMEKLVDSGMLAAVIDLTTTGSLRSPDGRRVPGDRRPLWRCYPQPPALHRLRRRARHGQFRRARHDPRALPPAQIPRSQSAGDADAHHAGGERAHRALDRRQAQPDGRAGALLPARRRRLRARRAGPAVLGSGGRRGAVHGAGAQRAPDQQSPALSASSATSTNPNLHPPSSTRSALWSDARGPVGKSRGDHGEVRTFSHPEEVSRHGRQGRADRRRRRRHWIIRKMRGSRRRRPDRDLQFRPLSHGRARLACRHDALMATPTRSSWKWPAKCSRSSQGRRCWPASTAPTRSATWTFSSTS
jgi:hypothetical protein